MFKLTANYTSNKTNMRFSVFQDLIRVTTVFYAIDGLCEIMYITF